MTIFSIDPWIFHSGGLREGRAQRARAQGPTPEGPSVKSVDLFSEEMMPNFYYILRHFRAK